MGNRGYPNRRQLVAPRNTPNKQYRLMNQSNLNPGYYRNFCEMCQAAEFSGLPDGASSPPLASSSSFCCDSRKQSPPRLARRRPVVAAAEEEATPQPSIALRRVLFRPPSPPCLPRGVLIYYYHFLSWVYYKLFHIFILFSTY